MLTSINGVKAADVANLLSRHITIVITPSAAKDQCSRCCRGVVGRVIDGKLHCKDIMVDNVMMSKGGPDYGSRMNERSQSKIFNECVD